MFSDLEQKLKISGCNQLNYVQLKITGGQNNVTINYKQKFQAVLHAEHF